MSIPLQKSLKLIGENRFRVIRVLKDLNKNEQHAPVGTAPDYHRFAGPYGQVTGKPNSLKFYRYENKLPEIEKLVKDHGYQHYYAGGKYGKPDLAKKNYNTGHLMIYDPSPASGGDFGDHQYTDGWRKIHELAHALVYPELNSIYGEGRRIGKLITHRTPTEAMRAVHWEWLAAHKQRELSKQIGVHLSDEDFNKELNTVMHDAVHRAVTGKFTDPGEEGFVPHGHAIPLAHALDTIRDEAARLSQPKITKSLKDLRKSALEKAWPKNEEENEANIRANKQFRQRAAVIEDQAQEQGKTTVMSGKSIFERLKTKREGILKDRGTADRINYANSDNLLSDISNVTAFEMKRPKPTFEETESVLRGTQSRMPSGYSQTQTDEYGEPTDVAGFDVRPFESEEFRNRSRIGDRNYWTGIDVATGTPKRGPVDRSDLFILDRVKSRPKNKK